MEQKNEQSIDVPTAWGDIVDNALAESRDTHLQRGEKILPITQADSKASIQTLINDLNTLPENSLQLRDHDIEIGFSPAKIDLVVQSLFDTYGENFSPELSSSIVDAIKIVDSSDFDKRKRHYSYKDILNCIEATSKSHDDSIFPLAFNLTHELRQDNGKNAERKLGIFEGYSTRHKLNAQRIQAFKDSLFPKLDANEETIHYYDVPNNYSSDRNGWGLSDFATHAFTSEINPQNIHSLLHIIRTIPTSEYAKFEQNRIDAVALQSIFVGLKDLIHRQIPGISNLINIMIPKTTMRSPP